MRSGVTRSVHVSGVLDRVQGVSHRSIPEGVEVALESGGVDRRDEVRAVDGDGDWIPRACRLFGAQAVVAMSRHSAPETGALAKTASGAMERQPYLRVRNLADAMVALQNMGYLVLGLDGEAEQTIDQRLEALRRSRSPGRAGRPTTPTSV